MALAARQSGKVAATVPSHPSLRRPERHAGEAGRFRERSAVHKMAPQQVEPAHRLGSPVFGQPGKTVRKGIALRTVGHGGGLPGIVGVDVFHKNGTI